MRSASNYCHHRYLVLALTLLLSAGLAGHAWSQPAGRRHVAAKHSVGDTTLVKATADVAVIRGAAGALEKIKTGDFVGTTKAVVKEIAPGRLVLEESFIDKDGKPNRALIIIKEGERGGTRYLQRADEPAITGTKPLSVMPAVPDRAKPTPKKPPQKPSPM